MARNEQLVRQHKLLEILERLRYGATLAELRDGLVEELGLSSLHQRSVRRDLNALQVAGIDVDVHDEQRGKVWKLGPRSRGTHKISATATEILALSLGRDLMYPLAGTPFWIGIQSFWSKLQDELPSSVWEHYQKFRQFLFVMGMPAKSYEAQHGILKTINRAIMEHRVVEIEYASIGKEPATRQIQPMAVVFYQNSLYIIASVCGEDVATDDRIRHWKLDRFQKATALDEWFKPDPDFDVDKHVAQSMGIFAGRKAKKFRIAISRRAAPWVLEDPWHPEQVVERQPDGSIILTVQAGHELEIIPRVLGLGLEAELLSPAAVRKNMGEIVATLADRYKDV